MRILIVEDEQLTARNLAEMVRELISDARIVGMLSSVREAVAWFADNAMPDLVFMDIHLSDGSSFSIFDRVDIRCPIIFTTAYDEYALRAFEVNSVGYLLKPVGKEALGRALKKVELLRGKAPVGDAELIRKVADAILRERGSYRSSLLVSVRDKFIPLRVADIACVYFEDKKSVAIRFDGTRHTVGGMLDEVMRQLDPRQFYRANRQFIIARAAVKDITVWFGSRIAVNLVVEVPERIVVSRAGVAEFKKWITD
ncbi:MAG: LytTR family DNA-binding domain-containing protein [Alistipes sp.]|jgi:two-component system LytT family response regulator|nr:LytTR family DNA-binding domain-containing protein [Alistipes sp.]